MMNRPLPDGNALPPGEANREWPAPSSGRDQMPKIVHDIRTLEACLQDMEPWPGLPEGTRAIVTRLVSETEHYEELKVLGYLRLSQVFPVSMLYDQHGIALGQSFKPGDFVDSFQTFSSLKAEILKRASEPPTN